MGELTPSAILLTTSIVSKLTQAYTVEGSAMLRFQYALILTVVSLLVSTAATAEVRKWTSDNGKHTIEAELVRVDDEKVTLRRNDGRTVVVPVERLSKSDQTFVRTTSTKTDSNQGRDVKATPDGKEKETSIRLVVLENVHEDMDRFGPIFNFRIPRELVRQTILMVARDDSAWRPEMILCASRHLSTTKSRL